MKRLDETKIGPRPEMECRYSRHRGRQPFCPRRDVMGVTLVPETWMQLYSVQVSGTSFLTVCHLC